jgi:hypothetical protein
MSHHQVGATSALNELEMMVRAHVGSHKPLHADDVLTMISVLRSSFPLNVDDSTPGGLSPSQ